MTDMISSKLFRTGGSVAVRIPAGWMDPASRSPSFVTLALVGFISHKMRMRIRGFFEFLRGKPYEPDSGFDSLSVRDEPPRQSPFDR